MSETPEVPVAPEVPDPAVPDSAPGAGWFGRELGHLLPHARHAEAGLELVATDSRKFLTGHAGAVLDFTGDAMALLEMVDPADAALFAAISRLVPKAIAAGQSALTLASAALKGDA